MLKIDEKITIKSWELSEQFIKASGPGGQHVNKTSSAVELRFEAEKSPSLSQIVKIRLKKIAGSKWTKDCLLYTSPSPRDGLLSRMPSSA